MSLFLPKKNRLILGGFSNWRSIDDAINQSNLCFLNISQSDTLARSIDLEPKLSLFTKCNKEIECHLKENPTNPVYGDCWHNQMKGISPILRSVWWRMLTSNSAIGDKIVKKHCQALHYRLITYTGPPPYKLDKYKLGLFLNCRMLS